MDTANITSFRALAEAAGVSEWILRQLRRGAIAKVRLEDLLSLSSALGLGLEALVAEFSPVPPVPVADSQQLQQEYQRLQQQLEQQRLQLEVEFQAQALATIESWLLQWPTAAYAVNQNPTVPAARLLPLMRPLENLLAQWEVVAIAPVGAEVAYDPQHHQLMEGSAEPGELVRVRYIGYRQGERLLYRAKVSPVGG